METREEQMARAWNDAEERKVFWEAHYAEFAAKYPEQFVAVSRDTGQVIAVDESLDGVLDAAEEKGYTQHQVWLKYIDTGREFLLV